MSEAKEILNRVLFESTADIEAEISTVVPSAKTSVHALGSVLNYILTDAFDLNAEETMWVGYHLGNILSPLNNIIPTALMGAVKQEMMTGEYSNRLFKRDNTNGQTLSQVSGVKYAPIEDWVESLSEVALSGYPTLRPMIKSSIIGSFHGLLTELGISSNARKSRGSLYLPNAVRHLLGSRR